MLLCGLVLVNFVIGVIIDNFSSSCESDELPISKTHVAHFAQVTTGLPWALSKGAPQGPVCNVILSLRLGQALGKLLLTTHLALMHACSSSCTLLGLVVSQAACHM